MKKLIKIAAIISTGLLSFGASAQKDVETDLSFSMKTVCKAVPLTCGVFPSGDGFGSEMPKDPPKKDP
ncbi:hypothetical protein HHX48_00565 [Salinimonas sp. HHU 13199]|uniref:Uncharacterized protein n=1 Tax=Salinimonas profundi TaxID=2729140 RepID=A0ABR8LJF5_9ALTE|nr:hypothetical protein [Salinimonas profundi]MBD3584225.1 hypothetical protein [Salinimonas profundi]